MFYWWLSELTWAIKQTNFFLKWIYKYHLLDADGRSNYLLFKKKRQEKKPSSLILAIILTWPEMTSLLDEPIWDPFSSRLLWSPHINADWDLANSFWMFRAFFTHSRHPTGHHLILRLNNPPDWCYLNSLINLPFLNFIMTFEIVVDYH